MRLNIITINYNDANGLAKTLKSVADQHIPEDFHLEHIIIDGGSTDSSVNVIRDYEKLLMSIGGSLTNIGVSLKWISEKDSGVYNAMNKGIEIALGFREVDSFNRSELVEDKHAQRSTERENKGGSLEPEHYIQILNAGDILASSDVLANVRGKMEEVRTTDGAYPDMICGNMLKQLSTGKIIRDDNGCCEDMSFFRFFTSTLNHDCVWIKRDLFERFGLYDENLKIVSDWKWYLQVIALAGIKPVYVDINMTIFDMTGISERNIELRNKERELVLREIMPIGIYEDYAARKFDIEQMNRLHRYPWAYKLVWFIERVLKKMEDKCRK